MLRVFLATIVANLIALYAAAILVNGFTLEGGVGAFLAAALVLALANKLLKPLMKLVSLPFIFMSMGIFLVVINAAILWLTQKLVAWLVVQPQLSDTLSGVSMNFAAWTDYFIVAVILWAVDYFTHWFLKLK